jgi:hypothetical protein
VQSSRGYKENVEDPVGEYEAGSGGDRYRKQGNKDAAAQLL